MLLIWLSDGDAVMNRLLATTIHPGFVRRPWFYLLVISLLVLSHYTLAATTEKTTDGQLSNHDVGLAQTLIEKAEQLRLQGYYNEALNKLQKAQQSGSRSHAVLATGLQGYLLLLMRDYTRSEQLLLSALQDTVKAGWNLQSAMHANHLGNFYAAQNNPIKARQFYQEARLLALKAEDPALVARIDINQLKLADTAPEQAWAGLLRLQQAIPQITDLRERAQLQLALGYQALQLNKPATVSQQQYLQFTRTALQQALTLATTVSSPRMRSNAYQYLGKLAEYQQQYAIALKQTQFGIAALQGLDAKDLLLKLEWQRGRLLRKLGNNNAAITAYRLSVNHIQAIRGDIPVDYQNGRSSFRETLQPVYTGLADLLIQQADQASDDRAQQALLREARNTIERVKQTELEDYFENRCTLQTIPEQAIDNIAANTAAIYPVILEDRLELLLSIGGRIEHRSVPVSAVQLTQTARRFADKLRHYKPDYSQDSLQLYNWLIAPVNSSLQRLQIDTLIFIPDGVLRLVPLAALSDGSKFLIQHYAVVTSPGLKLFDPKPLSRNKLDTLLAGMSTPGSVIEDLPEPSLRILINAVNSLDNTERGILKSRDINRLLVDDDPKIVEPSLRSVKEMIKDSAISDQIRKILALPGVSDEIKKISKLLPSTVLLNEAYSKKKVDQTIKQSPYDIIHIASHGVFGGSASESYIMAYDKILTVTELETLLQSASNREQPIELLTLSACQTAEGDDRSPLGISGIAIKAKVRSALGSLWPVSDIATVDVMTRFYQQLKSANTTKARALQKTQQHLLNNPEYQHPFFWSPFILIGNWL